MKSFNERIREISDEASNFIACKVKEPIKIDTENEDVDRLYVTAYDFDGEPYEAVVAAIYDNGEIEDWDGNTISLDDLSCQSVARIADYVRE